MTDRELNIALREMARNTGLCDEWYNAWSDDSTIDECLERYVRGIDFAIKHDWPPLAFIRRHFRKEDLHRHLIYIDEEVDINGENGYYVFLGKCTGRLTIDGLYATTVYVRHESHIDVLTANGAKVFLSYYEHGDGRCEHDGWSRIMTYDRREKKEGA